MMKLTQEQVQDVARVLREQDAAVRKAKRGRKAPVKTATESKAPRGRGAK